MKVPFTGPVAYGVCTDSITKLILETIRKINDKSGKSDIYFGLIGLACYVESIFESSLILKLTIHKNKKEDLDRAIYDEVIENVKFSTGINGWVKPYNKSMKANIKQILSQNWEALEKLFQLRNLLAHGRNPRLKKMWAAESGRYLGTTLEGSSYKRIFDYLRKKKNFSF